jgi:glycerol kinase
VPVDDVRLGTVDSWLLWRLTGRHVTEAGNASRTLLLGLESLTWDDELLEVFGIPRSALPAVLPSDGEYGVLATDGPLPTGLPVLAVMADSHAALFAQGCRKPGEVKATYGTGSSVMTPYDGRPGSAPAGLSATLAWLTADGPTYALEGNIIASGAAIETVARLVGAHGGAELTQLASEVDSSGGVVCVPAFAGLGAPYWDREAQGLLAGLTGGTTRAQLARAALDAVAHQVTDVVLAMEDAGVALPELCADGGATSSRLLMQTQADLLGRPVRVTPTAEASALGAALLAWERLSGAPAPERHDHAEGTATYVPAIDDARRSAERSAWAAAVARSRGRAVPAPQTTSTTTKES